MSNRFYGATPNDSLVAPNHPKMLQSQLNELTLIPTLMSDVVQCHVTINCKLNGSVYSCVFWTLCDILFIYLFLLAYAISIVLHHLQCSVDGIVYFVRIYRLSIDIVCSSLSVFECTFHTPRANTLYDVQMRWEIVEKKFIRSILSFSLYQTVDCLLRQTYEQ